MANLTKTWGTVTEESIMAQLDADKPSWTTEWADQTTLRELAERRITAEQARVRVIRMIWPAIRAAYMVTVENETD